MTFEELVDLMARTAGGEVHLALTHDRQRNALVLSLRAQAAPGVMRPVAMDHLIDPRTAASRGVSRALRQIAGEVGHEAARQVERPVTKLVDAIVRGELRRGPE